MQSLKVLLTDCPSSSHSKTKLQASESAEQVTGHFRGVAVGGMGVAVGGTGVGVGVGGTGVDVAVGGIGVGVAVGGTGVDVGGTGVAVGGTGVGVVVGASDTEVTADATGVDMASIPPHATDSGATIVKPITVSNIFGPSIVSTPFCLKAVD